MEEEDDIIIVPRKTLPAKRPREEPSTEKGTGGDQPVPDDPLQGLTEADLFGSPPCPVVVPPVYPKSPFTERKTYLENLAFLLLSRERSGDNAETLASMATDMANERRSKGKNIPNAFDAMLDGWEPVRVDLSEMDPISDDGWPTPSRFIIGRRGTDRTASLGFLTLGQVCGSFLQRVCMGLYKMCTSPLDPDTVSRDIQQFLGDRLRDGEVALLGAERSMRIDSAKTGSFAFEAVRTLLGNLAIKLRVLREFTGEGTWRIAMWNTLGAVNSVLSLLEPRRCMTFQSDQTNLLVKALAYKAGNGKFADQYVGIASKLIKGVALSPKEQNVFSIFVNRDKSENFSKHPQYLSTFARWVNHFGHRYAQARSMADLLLPVLSDPARLATFDPRTLPPLNSGEPAFCFVPVFLAEEITTPVTPAPIKQNVPVITTPTTVPNTNHSRSSRTTTLTGCSLLPEHPPVRAHFTTRPSLHGPLQDNNKSA